MTKLDAIQLIAAAQQPNGSFLSLSSSSNDFSNPIIYRTTFFTSLILSCLNASSDPELQPIKQKCVAFLLEQKSPQWSFNYWDRTSPEFSSLPYPDDLDDTFCALGSLAEARPDLITGQVLAQAVTLLTAQEVEPGGPYRTWLVSSSADPVWQDVDLAVNSNIAWFLAKQGVSLPGLTTFLEQKIQAAEFHSPYYPAVFPLIYFLSRAYQGPLQTKVTDYLIASQQSDGSWGNILHTALAVCALLRSKIVGTNVDRAIEWLQKQSLTAVPFCADPTISNQAHFAGSPALTAAFCLEALNLYNNPAQMTAPIIDIKKDQVYAAVVNRVQQHFATLPGLLSKQAQELLEITIKKDTDKQIALLPYWFAKACGKEADQQDLIISLGVANTYGWMAYTIYDNIIDDAQEVSLLPLANICLRETVAIFAKHTSAEFQKQFHQILDEQEAANAWEIQFTRHWPDLPDYGNYSVLAEKSFGHAAGPLAVMSQLGYASNSPQMTKACAMFKHYLIARQLNDDAHDWQEDLSKGQINSVASLLLRQWQAQGKTLLTDIDMTTILPALQEQFWGQTINQVSQLILHHVQLARQCCEQLDVIKDKSFLEQIVKPLESAANRAVKESMKAKDFLSSYTEN